MALYSGEPAVHVLADPSCAALITAVDVRACVPGSHPSNCSPTLRLLIGPWEAAGAPGIQYLATCLAWRISDLASPPAEEAELGPDPERADEEIEALLREVAREHDSRQSNLPEAPGQALPLDAEEGSVVDSAEDSRARFSVDRLAELAEAAARFYTEAYRPDSPAAHYVRSRFGADLSTAGGRWAMHRPGGGHWSTTFGPVPQRPTTNSSKRAEPDGAVETA